MRVSGFNKVKPLDELKNKEKHGKINIGTFCKLQIANSIEDIKIPIKIESVDAVMQHIGDRAKYYDGVRIEVIDDAELIKHRLLGWTSDDGKHVQFYPLAFVNVENLSITIAHESKHMQQVIEDGIKTDSVTLKKKKLMHIRLRTNGGKKMAKGLNVHMRVLTGYEAHKILASIDVSNPVQKVACPICKHEHLQIERVSSSETERQTVIITCSNCGIGTHFTMA